MKKILHISYDFRDRLGREKTTAVLDLVNVTRSFVNVFVLDCLRVPNFQEEKIVQTQQNFWECSIFGLPAGSTIQFSQKRAFRKIHHQNDPDISNLLSFDIIHAHKLTYDGYLAYLFHQKYKKPFFITLRQTDFFVFKYRPDLILKYKRVLAASSIIFYIMPFMIQVLKKYVGKKFFHQHVEPKLNFLPNIVRWEDKMNSDLTPEKGHLLAVLRMTRESVHRKNINRLFKAFQKIENKHVQLNIIGDGDYMPVIKKWIKQYGLYDRVKLIGSVPNEEIENWYQKSEAFVLPSLSESFGFVYAEALMTGTPIMYSQGTGFDGLFNDVGVCVDPKSISGIREGIQKLIMNNRFYRNHIHKLHQQKAFDIFQKPSIKKRYEDILDKILN